MYIECIYIRPETETHTQPRPTMTRFKVTLTTPNTKECYLVYATNGVHAIEIVKYHEEIKFNPNHSWVTTKATDRTKFDNGVIVL